MMTYPAPPLSDPSPAPAPYTPQSERNAAAITSLVCAILWPLVLLAVLLWNASHCTTTYICTYTPTNATPTWFSTLTGFFLIVLPPVGIISGVLGLVRSYTRPLLHGTRWQAIVGLLFGLMWLAFTLLDWL
jgi:hypothetical protein